MSLKFVMIGVGGYIAPRHLKAIKDVGGELIAAVDPNDSVGIIDSYFPDSEFFTEFEKFDAFVSANVEQIDYVAICSPNYLHKPHIAWALRKDINVICEKPLVLDVESLDEIERIESKSKASVYSILQLRLHDEILGLKEEIERSSGDRREVELTYITSRGKWYDVSWKGDDRKSGGVVLNIGIHFFDMLSFLFGAVQLHDVHLRDARSGSGVIELESATVKWFLSVDESYLPEDIVAKGQKTYRNIQVGDQQIEFSGGFTELHTKSYESIVGANGFGMAEVRPSIQLVNEIQVREVKSNPSLYHRFLES